MQRKIPFVIAHVDVLAPLAFQQKRQHARTSISMCIYHGQVHRSPSLIFLRDETFGKGESQDFENCGACTIRTSVVHRKHAPAIGQFRSAGVTEQFNVCSHGSWVIRVPCCIEMKRGPVLVVLCGFTFRICVRQNLKNVRRRSIRTSMMKGQPAVAIYPANYFWSRLHDIINDILGRIIELAHEVKRCHVRLSANVCRRSTVFLAFVSPEPAADLIPSRLNLLAPTLKLFHRQSGFVWSGDGVFKNLE
mmetsp:Transcript_7840/g.12378  ORF Transcript_7840/g.12378 Transcript_7840/m.12378 type:complete len:248 (-) Transcript_7840:383-1126(-)